MVAGGFGFEGWVLVPIRAWRGGVEWCWGGDGMAAREEDIVRVVAHGKYKRSRRVDGYPA